LFKIPNSNIQIPNKLQIPNPKLQIPNKFQISKTEIPN